MTVPRECHDSATRVPRECRMRVPPECHESAATVPRECRQSATRVPPQCRESAATVPRECRHSATRVPRECRHSASGIRMYDREDVYCSPSPVRVRAPYISFARDYTSFCASLTAECVIPRLSRSLQDVLFWLWENIVVYRITDRYICRVTQIVL